MEVPFGQREVPLGRFRERVAEVLEKAEGQAVPALHLYRYLDVDGSGGLSLDNLRAKVFDDEPSQWASDAPPDTHRLSARQRSAKASQHQDSMESIRASSTSPAKLRGGADNSSGPSSPSGTRPGSSASSHAMCTPSAPNANGAVSFGRQGTCGGTCGASPGMPLITAGSPTAADSPAPACASATPLGPACAADTVVVQIGEDISDDIRIEPL